ncbi:MAG: ABC transporter permease subunit [Bacteroidetes bacterium]|jgi:NitT/TauT family transport system permease protein|nr:ABC transporter permease subunit [Bacteroidota bacterium]MDF1866693.1 ABC transporter permease subunit [Saprospiraceae bacterium]
MSLFKLRGELSKSQSLFLGIGGIVFIILLWWILAEAFARKVPVLEHYNTELPSLLGADSLIAQQTRDSLILSDSIAYANATEFRKVYPTVPLPSQVVQSYPKLVQKDELFYNSCRSVWLNLQGYFWAIVICIPIGFLIGLVPLFKGLFSKPVDALRYLPLTALIGIFIIWFGIYDEMKIAFLAFGIIVYLLPVVAQRIGEVNDVYTKTVFTLGANDWQTVKNVYFPSVMAKVIDDIRVLTAISWTYIIVAEYINKDGGGLGALIYIKRRLGQVPDMFAILLIIVLIGFFQDRLFIYLDKRLFPHKYYKTTLNGILEVKYGLWAIFGIMTFAIIQNMFIPSLGDTMPTLALIAVIAGVVFIIYGEIKVRGSLKNS